MRLLILFLLVNLLPARAQNAQEIFLNKLTAFENVAYEKHEIDMNGLYETRGFLIEVTGITYEMEKTFEFPIFPPDHILKAWRAWFEENKYKLYWDVQRKTVAVRKE